MPRGAGIIHGTHTVVAGRRGRRMRSVCGLVVGAAIVSVGYVAVAQTPQKITVTSPTLKDGETMPGTTRRTAATFRRRCLERVPAPPRNSRSSARILTPATRRRSCTGSSTRFRRRRKGCPKGCRSIRRRRCRPDLAGAIQGVSGFRRAIYRGPGAAAGKAASLSLRRLCARRGRRLKPGQAPADARRIARRDQGPRHRTGRTGRDLRDQQEKHRNRARGVDAVGVSDSRAMHPEWH